MISLRIASILALVGVVSAIPLAHEKRDLDFPAVGGDDDDFCSSTNQYWEQVGVRSGQTWRMPQFFKGYKILSPNVAGTEVSSTDSLTYHNQCFAFATKQGADTVEVFYFNDSKGNSFIRCAAYAWDDSFYSSPSYNNWGQKNGGSIRESVGNVYSWSMNGSVQDGDNPCGN